MNRQERRAARKDLERTLKRMGGYRATIGRVASQKSSEDVGGEIALRMSYKGQRVIAFTCPRCGELSVVHLEPPWGGDEYCEHCAPEAAIDWVSTHGVA